MIAWVSGRHGVPSKPFLSGFKDRFPRPFDACFEVRIAHSTWLDEIDRAANESLERLFEIKMGVEGERFGMLAIEFHKKIDIAALGVEIAARRRAKKIEPTHMKPAAQHLQFLTMQFDFVNHYRRTFSLSRLCDDTLGVPHPQLTGDEPWKERVANRLDCARVHYGVTRAFEKQAGYRLKGLNYWRRRNRDRDACERVTSLLQQPENSNGSSKPLGSYVRRMQRNYP